MSPDRKPSTMTLLMRLSRCPDDGDLWHEFANRYMPIIYRWCRRYVQDADAEDITAIVLDKILEAIRSEAFTPRNREHPNRWINTITRHTRLDLERRKQVPGREVGTGGIDYSFLDSAEAVNDLERRIVAEHAREVIELALLGVRPMIAPDEEQIFRAVHLEEQQVKVVAERFGKAAYEITRIHQKVFERVAAEVKRIEAEDVE